MKKKIFCGMLLIGFLLNYIFPTTVNVTEYGTYIEFFNGEGYFIEK